MSRVAARARKTLTQSRIARRQKQLAWLLYITEGYKANIAYAATMNAFDFTNEDMRLLQHIYNDVGTFASRIRVRMK